MIRVLVCDDQAMVRSGLRMILEAEPDIEVCGEAGDGAEGARSAVRLAPDVVLMDVRMPNVDGIEGTRRIVESGVPCRVLVLTTFDLDDHVHGALAAGAAGFLLKDAPAQQLVEAVRVVAAGDALLAPAVLRRVIEEHVTRRPRRALPGLAELTAREQEVLVLMARGHSNAEIARELGLGEPTVKTHVARVLQKLDVRDRVQAVVAAHESGFVGRVGRG